MKDKLLFITDTYKDLNLKKDTTILMIEEAFKNKFLVYQCELNDLFFKQQRVYAQARKIPTAHATQVDDIIKEDISISDFKYTFMRKDPPVNEDYINALHLLSLAETQGAKIFNKPNSIKEFNEKIFSIHFKDFIPRTLITSNILKITDFYEDLEAPIVVKPLDGMGGKSIYMMEEINEEEYKILKRLTNNFKTQIVIQEFLPDIYDGDFRVLIIHGEPYTKTLARIPQGGSFKGNLAAGGKGEVRDISEVQMRIGSVVGEYLTKKDINFAGIDIIGQKLTEINITSPTCAREIFEQSGMNPIEDYFKKL